MIGRVEKSMLAGILILLVILFLLMAYQSSAAESQEHTYNISVLVHAPSDRFRQGLNQAALDYNVDVHLLSTFDQDGNAQQEAYLKRELQNDADAIVLYARDVDTMQAFLKDMKMHARVITVGQRLSNASIETHVGVNDTALGEKLGRLIAERSADIPCAIVLSESVAPNVAERAQGLQEVLSAYGVASETLYCGADGIAKALEGRPHETVAVLDEEMLLPLCEQARAEDVLYGAGYVSAVRSYLESGRIAGLVVYSEFDAGYLSLKAAALAAAGKPSPEVELGLYVVDAQTMYDTPFEQILFPIG